MITARDYYKDKYNSEPIEGEVTTSHIISDVVSFYEGIEEYNKLVDFKKKLTTVLLSVDKSIKIIDKSIVKDTDRQIGRYDTNSQVTKH